MGKDTETRGFFDLKKQFIFYASYHNDSVSVKTLGQLLQHCRSAMSTFSGECGDPPALHLEPCLVRDGLAAHARRLCPGPDLDGHLAPGGRGATHPRHHHHRHLCRVLRHDGPGGWRSWSPPHACAQPGFPLISFH